MSTTRLRSLTAISFAVIYGLVGLTGSSLHYLATDGMWWWSSSPSVVTVVYYHVHGPDYHGHFHRHTHDGHHSHDANVAASEHDRATDHAAIRMPHDPHRAHACPILSLVSTLKLGHASGGTPALVLDTIVAPAFACDVSHAFEVALYWSARGPPSDSLA